MIRYAGVVSGKVGGRLDRPILYMFGFKKVLYLNGPFSIPNRTYSPPIGI